MSLKKSLRFFTVILTVMMMTLPIYAQKVDHYFYGELDQWPQIQADVAATRSGKVQSLKATQTDEALYLNLKMPIPAAVGTFYLETESGSHGYYGRGLWRDNPSIHYKVENGILYSYKGTGFCEDWSEIGPVEITLLKEDLIVRVGFELLGLDAPQPLKVAYYLDPLDYLPTDDSPMLKVSRRIFADETTVYDQDFWNSRSTAAHNIEQELRLQAVRDHQKLFVLVNGWDLNTRNTYFIETEAVDGYAHPSWPGSHISHKIDSGILYRYSEASEVAGWDVLGPVFTYITAEAVVMSVDLALLKSSWEAPLKLGYENGKGNLLPLDSNLISVTALIEQPIRANAFYPTEYHGILNNPYKGWVPWAQSGSNPQPHRLVYAGISWRELEPERGEFDWHGIEETYLFDYWDARGVKFVVRLVLDTPRKGTPVLDIPTWLYEMTEGSGTWYNTSEVGNGFSPDYINPVFIAEHERMIAALAERYNNDPRVAFIQLGSLGHWGEWHTWPEGSGVFPDIPVSDQYVTHYLQSFPNKMIGLRRPFAIVKENRLGLFNDMFGDQRSSDEWIGWFEQGRLSEPPMPDFWKYAFSGGEFSSGNALLHLTDAKIADVLRLARESHTSWLGPCSPAVVVAGAPEQVHLDALLKTIGYRFVLTSVEHTGQIQKGESLSIVMNWKNKGVAPFYFSWPLCLALVDESGQIGNTYRTLEDIRHWLPGEISITTELPIDPALKPGTYSLVVGILDPETNRPGIDLAIAGRRDDGWYTLNNVTVID